MVVQRHENICWILLDVFNRSEMAECDIFRSVITSFLWVYGGAKGLLDFCVTVSQVKDFRRQSNSSCIDCNYAVTAKKCLRYPCCHFQSTGLECGTDQNLWNKKKQRSVTCSRDLNCCWALKLWSSFAYSDYELNESKTTSLRCLHEPPAEWELQCKDITQHVVIYTQIKQIWWPEGCLKSFKIKLWRLIHFLCPFFLSENVKHLLVQASQMWGFAAFLCQNKTVFGFWTVGWTK